MIHASELQTERLVVRPFALEDADLLVDLFSDPRVHRYVGEGRELSDSDARLWVVRSRDNLARYGYGTGAVIRRDSGLFVGWAGFARPAEGEEEVVYGLAADQWGQGLGRELLDGVVRFATKRGLAPLRATVDPANAASIRILTGTGFRLVERRHRGDPDSDLYLRQGAVSPD